MTDPSEIVDSSMLGGLQRIWLPRARHERRQRGEWEATRLCSMRHHLTHLASDTHAPVIYDVGSEMGDLSVLYALWGCEVVLCEANPQAWPWARITWEANDLDPPKEAWWGFISDTTTFPDLSPEGSGWRGFDTERWPPCAYLPPEPETGFVTHHERAQDWPTTTIDLLSDVVVARTAAITVDVEGHELSVMRGAERVLREERPLVWLSEHDDAMRSIGDDPGDLLDFMDGCGYEPEFLCVDHERHVLWYPAEYEWPT